MKFPLIPGLYRILATLLSIIGQVLPIVQHPRYQSYMTSLINRLSQLSDDVLVSAVQVEIFLYVFIFMYKFYAFFMHSSTYF